MWHSVIGLLSYAYAYVNALKYLHFGLFIEYSKSSILLYIRVVLNKGNALKNNDCESNICKLNVK